MPQTKSGLTAKQRNQQAADLASGNIDIVIGTHAIISEKTKFKALGLAIVDEQHKCALNSAELLCQHTAAWLTVMPPCLDATQVPGLPRPGHGLRCAPCPQGRLHLRQCVRAAQVRGRAAGKATEQVQPRPPRAHDDGNANSADTLPGDAPVEAHPAVGIAAV